MEWGREQDAALQAVADWLDNGTEQVFRLFGYAGTGKTTLARHFAEGVEGTVLFGAYTGKAAHVLRTKGCAGAATIHSMIYRSKEKGKSRLKDLELQLVELQDEIKGPGYQPPSEGVDFALINRFNKHPKLIELRKEIEAERTDLARPLFSLNQESPVRGAKLVVIDECSMVDGQMGDDLLSFGAKVLVLGDPAQLPPVGGAGFFTENVRPDVMLTDIHRQARDNPIIAMATQVRNEQALNLGTYGESEVLLKARINEQMAMEADQILVGRNATRHASNRRARSLLGFGGDMPEITDKLVCLRNNNEDGLLNGAIWHVEDTGFVNEHRCFLTLRSEADGSQLDTECHTHYFKGNGKDLPWYEKKEANEFDYGYALTVHKAQGSQWDNVMLFDESFAFRKDRWRWLYTGITRAAEKLTVVVM